MRKLNLIALSYERDGILNALQQTNAVEIKEHAETEGTQVLPACGEELRAYLSTLENALETLETVAKDREKGRKEKDDGTEDGLAVTYAEFIEAGKKREWADALVARIATLIERKNAAIAAQAAYAREIAATKPYEKAEFPFDEYQDTLHVKTRLGVLPIAAWEEAKGALDALSFVAYEEVRGQESVLVTVMAHRTVFAEAEEILSGVGFARCPYSGHITGAQQLADLEGRLRAEVEKQREAKEELVQLSSEIRTLKVYCDFVGFELEKAEAAGKMRATAHTFFLEAFVPAEAEERVKTALEGTMPAIWFEFSDPKEDEQVPTLLKNNPIVANFETITNTYSPPSSREFDPNFIMSFFYSLFLGFIMADVGYGFLMILGGSLLYFKNKKKQGGIKSLAGVFAVGGVFTFIWGLLFNSTFGMALFPYTSPMPIAYDLIGGTPFSTYTFVGIQVPALLVIAMFIGIAHLFTGYICKAVQAWRRGLVFDGICDGLTWAIFSLGMAVAVLGLVEEFGFPSQTVIVGAIIAGASLLFAALMAGRKEKIVGKFTKGFGALYGIINYLSDILSYARLYGLMLSGAVIAQLVSMYAVKGGVGTTPLIASGNIGLAILGVVLLVLGHVFNLGMGLLGAYIHDARLQYVEFYGRFFEGEGELFIPLGSRRRHIYFEEQLRQQSSANRKLKKATS